MTSIFEDKVDKEFMDKEIIIPEYNGFSTINLVSTLLKQFGVKETPSPLLHSKVGQFDFLNGVENIVFFVVDALGYNQLNYYISTGSMPNMEQFIKKAQNGNGLYSPITTVFPSTTATALTSIYTGLTPGKHGLLSYSVYLPEIGEVSNIVFSYYFSNGKKIKSFEPFLQQNTFSQYLSGVGVNTTSVADRSFRSSLLSKVHHRGSVFSGYTFPSTIPTLTLNSMQLYNRNWTTMYWPGLDSCAHKYGPIGKECEDEAFLIDSIFARTIQRFKERKLLDKTVFVLTADHGQVLNDANKSIKLNLYPELLSMLRLPPSGERRSLYLYPKKGEYNAVREWANDKGATVFSRQEAQSIGLFDNNTVETKFIERIGELIVLPPGQSQWIYDPMVTKEPVSFFKGSHGGLHTDEMLVPCLMLRI